MAMKKITVIGAGTMGRGIAQLLSRFDLNVHIVEQYIPALKEGKGKIKEQFEALIPYDLISRCEIDQALSRITISENLEDAKNSWMIIEAIPEVLELKQNLFNSLEMICESETIFATNTSGLSINDISKNLKNRKRFIGTHFYMPAAVVPLIEVIRDDETADDVCEEVMQFFREIDKKPVLIRKDIPGFIGNRIQHAMAREAISLLEQGIASAEEIDTVVRWSLGIRLLFTGPLEQRDLNGLDVHNHIASYLYKELDNRTEPSQLLSGKVEKGELGIKTGKGFYEWERSDQQETVQKKNIELLQLIKWLKNQS